MNKTPKAQEVNLSYAWFVVAILMLAYISSFIDRQILSLLVRPIRRDFEISDTQMSLLMGLSFAVFYTILGIPIGRLADHKSRKWIISVGILVWSMMTVLCGVAANYGQLFLARVGVGIGEAALAAPAYSLISDYFPREKLGLAISVFSMGIYIGSGLAFFLGGIVISLSSGEDHLLIPWIGEIYSWQIVFFIIGFPGILIALLVYLTVKEPERKNGFSQKTSISKDALVPMRADFSEVIGYIWANRGAFLGITLGLTFVSLIAYGSAAWIPTFLQRVYGWSPEQAGISYGLVVTVFATLGIIAGGLYADRLSHRYEDGRIRSMIIAPIGLLVTGLYYPFMPTGYLSVLFLIPACFFISFPVGTAAATLQEIFPNHMRAAASSIYLFILNLIAMSLGPTSVALCTDYVFKNDAMIGYSLTIVGFVCVLIATLSFYLSAKPYCQSKKNLEEYLKKYA
ncbi:MAG: MFS transporter [Microscillaceae bacterium]|nr:MFS transporter [Microscillaceae bacterium]